MSRILLADDSPHAQRMGERILREEGYEVVSVTDGDTAMKRMADVDPDVIVADVFLPGVNGFDLCRRVKSVAAHQHVRVIMTAGMLEVFDEDEARRAGADAIIKKPFEASVVIDTIKPLAEAAHAGRGSGPVEVEAVPEPVETVVPEPVIAAAPKYDVVVEPEPEPEPEYIPEPDLPLLDEYDEPEEPVAVAMPAAAIPVAPVPVPPVATPVAPAAPSAPPAPVGAIDPELVRAAVTVALDEALPSLIDDITERVLSALRKNH